MNKALARRYESKWECLVEAALGYADAGDDNAAFRRAKDRLRWAALQYAMDDKDRAPPIPTVGQMRHSLVAARRSRAPVEQLPLFR
jgi:hypothetical protein